MTVSLESKSLCVPGAPPRLFPGVFFVGDFLLSELFFSVL